MFQKLAHALHHLFNPHCTECESLHASARELQREHELEMRVCHSCETLKSQLEFQNQLIREMMRPKEELNRVVEEVNHQPIPPRHIPWTVTRNRLQREDRELAERLKAEKAAGVAEITQDDLDAEIASIQNAQSS